MFVGFVDRIVNHGNLEMTFLFKKCSELIPYKSFWWLLEQYKVVKTSSYHFVILEKMLQMLHLSDTHHN